MTQGSTPTHTFTLPFDLTGMKVRVVYAQMKQVVIRKEDDDLTVEGDTVTLTLTQQDTLRLRSDQKVEIQLKVLTAAGDALVSDIHTVSVARCLDLEVLE